MSYIRPNDDDDDDKWICRARHNVNVNVNVNVQYLSTRESCNKELRRLRHEGCLQQYRTVLISATVTLGMAVVHSNTWDLKLRRHVNHI